MYSGDEDHVRHLLDQRAQRADVPRSHYRFPSLSERSDSPSLYSHFSPAHHGYATPSMPTPRPNYKDQSSPQSPHPHESVPEDPDASGLDLSDDCSFDGESRYVDLDDDVESLKDPDNDDDEETRMSLLGPKMRVHCRAPWEVDDDDDLEEDQDNAGLDSFAMIAGKSRVMRGLGLASGVNSKSSGASRPSGDSSRSMAKSKKSFETTPSINAGGSALQALAQASMSSTSLALGSSPTSRLPHKLSVPRPTQNRARTTSGASSFESDTMPPPLPTPQPSFPAEQALGPSSPSSAYTRCQSPARSEFSISSDPRVHPSSPLRSRSGSYIHPYANPDLVGSYNRDSVTPFESSSDAWNAAPVSRSGSSVSLNASEETVIMSQSTSTNIAYNSSASTTTFVTPGTSTCSFVDSPSRVDSLKSVSLDKDKDREKYQKQLRRETKLGLITISAPSMITKSDSSPSSPYTLISLEQAQARAKERSRSVTVGAAPSFSNLTPLPFPSSKGNGAGSFTVNSESSGRSRARTNSAGSRAKQAFANLVGETQSQRLASDPLAAFPAMQLESKSPGPANEQPTGRTLKQKRSGFMKLFHAKEKEQGNLPPVPPPVPPLADSYLESRRPSVPTTSKITSQRVPVPQLSPSLISSLPLTVDGDLSNYSQKPPSPKRPGPGLSIQVTSPGISRSRTPSKSAESINSSEVNTATARSNEEGSFLSPKPPASAPPNMSQFAALSLRPVSTIFSNHFAGHLIDDENRLPAEGHGESPALSPPTTAMTDASTPSPTTPSFNLSMYARPSMPDRTSSEGNNLKLPHEDQSAVISALQEQIYSSRTTWQRQISELEGQVRDLRAEVEGLRSGDACQACGRGPTRQRSVGSVRSVRSGDSGGSVVDRPRARTGTGARFASGNY